MSKDVGACYVMRAAGSHTIADLAAFFPWHFVGTPQEQEPSVWLVQCKRDGRLPAEERELLQSLAREVGARPVLAKAGPRGTPVVLENLT